MNQEFSFACCLIADIVVDFILFGIIAISSICSLNLRFHSTITMVSSLI